MGWGGGVRNRTENSLLLLNYDVFRCKNIGHILRRRYKTIKKHLAHTYKCNCNILIIHIVILELFVPESGQLYSDDWSGCLLLSPGASPASHRVSEWLHM